MKTRPPTDDTTVINPTRVIPAGAPIPPQPDYPPFGESDRRPIPVRPARRPARPGRRPRQAAPAAAPAGPAPQAPPAPPKVEANVTVTTTTKTTPPTAGGGARPPGGGGCDGCGHASCNASDDPQQPEQAETADQTEQQVRVEVEVGVKEPTRPKWSGLPAVLRPNAPARGINTARAKWTLKWVTPGIVGGGVGWTGDTRAALDWFSGGVHSPLDLIPIAVGVVLVWRSRHRNVLYAWLMRIPLGTAVYAALISPLTHP